MDFFQPWHIIIVVGLALLIFGGKKLPELGKGLGEGFKGFKDGIKGVSDEVTSTAKVGDSAHTVTPKTDEAPKPPAAA